ncbi:MAG: trehalose-6-phosphate synthase [Natrialbaceae archaeon]|nr:trehalose-6-phosphate synthase [Natrialbaceae archaeon]
MAEFLPEAQIDRDRTTVRYDGEETTIAALPLGVDVEQIESNARETDPRTVRAITQTDPDQTLLVGVDRLDYTKGILERLDALERLWAAQPSLRESVTYVQKAEPSRESIPAYQRLQDRVAEAVARINNRFESQDWQPVTLVTDHLAFETLCGLYRDADVALVTPRRDGMNLVAQEYVASQVEEAGILVLSEFAGVHEHIGPHALSANPFDRDGLASVIARAIRMDPAERRARMHRLRALVDSLSIGDWFDRVETAARGATATPTDTVNLAQ